MEDFNSKYTGQQVEDLLDQVASGNAGGGDVPIASEDIYIAPFTVEDVAILTTDETASLSIPIALIEAVIAKKRVLIPSNYDFGNGFAELVYADGYIAEADAGLWAYFFMLGELYHIYIDDAINGDAIIATKEHVGMIRVADANSIVNITAIEQTTTSNVDGGSNIITATLSNGTKSTFTIKNGSKGSVGEQGPKGDTGATGPQGPKGDKGDKGDTGATGANGTNGKDGADGEDGATFTPSVDSEGNLSWTNDKGLTNPPTVNIKGPKGDKGDAGEGGGSGGGKEVVHISNGVIELLERDKIYIVEDSTGSRTFEIQAIEEIGEPGGYAEYTVIFASEDDMGTGHPLSIILPYNVYWANGEIPDLTLNANYELSIVGWEGYNNSGFNAVLTPFQYVE